MPTIQRSSIRPSWLPTRKLSRIRTAIQAPMRPSLPVSPCQPQSSGRSCSTGCVTDADDGLFATGLVDPLRLAHALLLAGARDRRRGAACPRPARVASTDILAGTGPAPARWRGDGAPRGREGCGTVSSPREVTAARLDRLHRPAGDRGRPAEPRPAADHRPGRRGRGRRPAGRAGAGPRRPHRRRRPGHRRAGPPAGLLRRGVEARLGQGRVLPAGDPGRPAGGRGARRPPRRRRPQRDHRLDRAAARRCRRSRPAAPSRWPTRSR